jgi:hypothetical protein
VELANKDLDHDTHLPSKLHTNRKGNPREVINAKLKKGDLVAMENSNGITVLKWHDKLNVTLLSTCHSNETVPDIRHSETELKPQAIFNYNSGKSLNDLHQMPSYSTSLSWSVKW